MQADQRDVADRNVDSRDRAAPGLIFGIYPGGAHGLYDGPPDDPARINAALDQLQGEHQFIVRGYQIYTGAGQIRSETPADMTQYLRGGRLLDLALCYCTPDGDLDDWCELVRATVRRYGPALTKIQIAEEPNNPDAENGGNGSFPNVREAIIAGVVAAKDEARRLGLDVQVGFNATPSLPGNDFWPGIGALVTPAFLEALDYVGFDFFPDVFRPLPPGPDGAPMKLEDAVSGVLTGFRRVHLAAGNIPASVPIHITENGWPTGPDRPPERQADVLETTIRTIYAHRAALNITHYELFDLRDTNSSSAGLMFQFGLLRDDYSPKPAFERYRQLIAELGVPVPACRQK